MEIQAQVRKIVDVAKKISNAYMIIEEPDIVLNGIRIRVWFSNGYGASCVKHRGTYGYNEGLWELAVLYGDEDNHTMAQRPEITGDDRVIGWLSVSDVIRKLNKISRF